MARWLKQVFSLTSVLLLACIGAQTAYSQPLGIGSSKAEEPQQHGILSSPNGRFVFGQISSSSKDLYMLDTATGRLWRMGESGKVGVYLKAVPYLDAEGECSLLPDRIPGPESKKPEKK